MQDLTADGRRIVEDLARRHGFSVDAVLTLLRAVAAGNGSQAQFNHFEFGGMGQWSQGGMIMIGDMFNNNLKYRVDGLANDLSNVVRNSTLYGTMPTSSQSQSQSGGQGQMQQSGGGGQWQSGGQYQSASAGGVSLFVPGSSSASNWWPAELGAPSSTGSQNNLRYAYFPSARRLAIQQDGRVTTYDSGNHQISGFAQQQSGDQSLTFTSQYGVVRVYDLPQITGAAPPAPPMQAQPMQAPSMQAEPMQPQPMPPQPMPPLAASPSAAGAASSSNPQNPMSADDIFTKIERLAELKQKSIITDQEFEAKKSDLLSRL